MHALSGHADRVTGRSGLEARITSVQHELWLSTTLRAGKVIFALFHNQVALKSLAVSQSMMIGYRQISPEASGLYQTVRRES